MNELIDRALVTQLITAGIRTGAIAYRIGCSTDTVRRIRREMVAAAAARVVTPGYFAKHTKLIPGDHLRWQGWMNRDGQPGYAEAAAFAFGLQHLRLPVGAVTPGCDYPRCVAPSHVEDQEIRDQFAAIFGTLP